MTQRANNRGRQATLDNKKQRAAGRQQSDPARAAIADRLTNKPMKGKTGGAFGKRATSRSSTGTKGAGGGGGAQSTDESAPMDTTRASKRTRKRS